MIFLPGWTCPSCKGWNGEAKERLNLCRSCKSGRPEDLGMVQKLLERPDLTMKERSAFLDMEMAIAQHGVHLSPGQLNWLGSVASRPVLASIGSESGPVVVYYRVPTKTTLGLVLAFVILCATIYLGLHR